MSTHVCFPWRNGMRTNARNLPVYAGIPSNAPTARRGSVAIDIVRIALLDFGGVRSQVIEKA